jgi:hypothetical protein
MATEQRVSTVILFKDIMQLLTRRPIRVGLVNKGVDVVQESQTSLDSSLAGDSRQGVSVEFLTDAAYRRMKQGIST